ncbi:unnamed protein product [Rotaria sordida]|uniref:Uncharacterized protein n=1 Tax=Rotaria sordida TaxID=392033 RepID=A0A814UTG2_9BILA|nr:unnamed protein product [Rotaria sordida]
MEKDFSTREGNQYLDDENDKMIDDSTATTTMTINKTNSTIVSIVPKEKKKKCRCYTRHRTKRKNLLTLFFAISTRKGEFKTGFERDGQICEQAMLVKKTVGIRYLVFLISKMDDSTVN